MTFEEFKSAVKYAHEHNHDWRMGQAAFNVLMLNRPDLSEQVRGSDLDPFHRNERLPRFYEWVKENWATANDAD